ncbi:hypothetical protein A9306_05670 [Moraxella atlantae]|uniref:Uncharacterized protein n=1 Tax=Faucicola atlantae TaxID=34059 RepID=A0A1B8QI17_9GAMM|nr:hypothetical protein A9306_05670 [Moraxella atlantae]
MGACWWCYWLLGLGWPAVHYPPASYCAVVGATTLLPRWQVLTQWRFSWGFDRDRTDGTIS